MDGPQPGHKARVKTHFPTRLRIMLETNAARDKAEVLLAGLLNAQVAMKQHTTNPVSSRIACPASMDRAIASTRRLIDSLNDALRLAEDDLGDETMSLLDEIDVEPDDGSETGRA